MATSNDPSVSLIEEVQSLMPEVTAAANAIYRLALCDASHEARMTALRLIASHVETARKHSAVRAEVDGALRHAAGKPREKTP